jgi:hypothetical protein
MALIGIALLGMLIVVMILLGGHWVRKHSIHRRGPVVPPDRLPLKKEASVALDARDRDHDADLDKFEQ